jgi:hypothetical protein
MVSFSICFIVSLRLSFSDANSLAAPLEQTLKKKDNNARMLVAEKQFFLALAFKTYL